MSNGAKALIAEIRKNHYTKKGEVHETPVSLTDKSGIITLRPEKKKRGRPPKASKETAASSEGVNANMFNVTIIGGLVINDYPLKQGEKLVIAKLSPINVPT